MKIITVLFRATVVLALVASTYGCATVRPSARDYSDRSEQAELEGLARDVLGLKTDGAVVGGKENVIGLRSGSVVLSRRLDSHTFFAHDENYGLDKAAGVFQGPEDQVVQRTRDLLQRLRIPGAEVEASTTRRENTQEAEVSEGKITLGPLGTGKVFAWVSRRVEGLPVFSSRAVVGLTRSGTVGFMEVHWPQIPEAVVTEAHRLDFKVRQGWRPPSPEGTTVESVQAGVLHSAAAGFLMDIYPVIRVIYAPKDRAIGKRATLYFNREGTVVPAPRQFELPCEKELSPRAQPPRQ